MIREVTRGPEMVTIGVLSESVLIKGVGLFQSKATRDAVVKELKRKIADSNFTDYGQRITFKVRKRTILRQRFHPEYVMDFVGIYETGFGNQDYLTMWNKLYKIELEKIPQPNEDDASYYYDRLTK